MWNYEKRLQYPVNIKTPNAKIAQIIMSQYGGPDGEMGASMRYLSQRFTAPNRITMGVLTDVGTEELGHLEMVATIVHQLTCNLTPEEIEKQGFANYYVDHTVGIWPQAAGAFRSMPVNSSPRATRSRIYSKTLLRNRKPGPLTTTSCVSSKIRKLRIRSVSSGRGKSYTSSGLAKRSDPYRKNLILRISTRSTQALTRRYHVRPVKNKT